MTNSLVAFGDRVKKQDLVSLGFEMEFSPTSKIRVGNLIEAPCSIQTAIRDINKFGAFSYINGRGRFTNVKIGRYCSIAESVAIGYPEHPSSWLSTSTLQYQRPEWAAGIGNWNRQSHTKTPQTNIGNDVWIGAGVFIRAGIEIGDGAILGAHAVVTRNVDPYSIVGGIPAKHIRYRVPLKLIEYLKESKWWDYSPVALNGCPFNKIQEALDFVNDLRASGTNSWSGPQVIITEEGAKLTNC